MRWGAINYPLLLLSRYSRNIKKKLSAWGFIQATALLINHFCKWRSFCNCQTESTLVVYGATKARILSPWETDSFSFSPCTDPRRKWWSALWRRTVSTRSRLLWTVWRRGGGSLWTPSSHLVSWVFRLHGDSLRPTVFPLWGDLSSHEDFQSLLELLYSEDFLLWNLLPYNNSYCWNLLFEGKILP